MEKIKSKKYYRIEFVLDSPLMIGAKQKERTDQDLLTDVCGKPFIPGSSLAGIYRSRLLMEEGEEKMYFGDVPDYEEWEESRKQKGSQTQKESKTNSAENKSSRIIVYDAVLKTGEKPHITRRDFVALDEYKTAKQGSKFDAEILEPGVSFVTFIEQNRYGEDRLVAEEIAQLWHSGQIRIGAKTMRGFGAVREVKISCAEFRLSEKEEAKKWLKFDLSADGGWTEWKPVKELSDSCSVKLTLELQGAVSVRRYTTDIAKDKNKSPDQEQLTVFENEKKCPVIPGSTWAGAFKSHMKKLIPELNLDYFGYVDDSENKKCKSKIRFSESKITGGKDKLLSRNAIDRFAGGTVNQALFMEKVYYGGVSELEIGFDRTIDEKMLAGLAALIMDLHYGFLSIGGATSAGRGLFKILAIDGKKLFNSGKETDSLYQEIVQILTKKRNGGSGN